MKRRRHEDDDAPGWGYLWLVKTFVILGLSAAIFIPAWKVSYILFIKPNIPPTEEEMAAATPPKDPSAEEFEKIVATIRGGSDPVEARVIIGAFIDTYPFSTKLEEAYDLLGKINTDIFFSAIPAPEKVRHVIQRGDAIAKLERRYDTSRELIMRCNNLEDPRRLRIGQVLFINQVSFAVNIDRKQKTVTLSADHRFFKRYRPVAWDAPEPKPGTKPTPITAKVRDRIALYNGRRVTFGSREYAASTRRVDLTAKGFTFYSENGPKPEGGIAFSAADMEELSTLLGKNVPVSIQ